MTNKEKKFLEIAIDILIELQGTVDSDDLDKGVDLLMLAWSKEQDDA